MWSAEFYGSSLVSISLDTENYRNGVTISKTNLSKRRNTKMKIKLSAETSLVIDASYSLGLSHTKFMPKHDKVMSSCSRVTEVIYSVVG